MNPLFRYFYLFFSLLLLPGFVHPADEKKPSGVLTLEQVLEEIGTEEFSPYGDYLCDMEDDDEGLPENIIETMYGNGRMAFLFGKYEVAYKAWEPLAQEGYAKAQASLAWMYHTGNGVKKDIAQAIGWYKLAAEQGHAIAQNNLGVMYENGLGDKVEKKIAVKWYKKSAKSGYSFAQYNLGRMYAEGSGVSQNLEEAKYWWRIAARQKVKKAAEALALLEKRPIPNDEKKKGSHSVAHAPYHSNPVAKGLAWVREQAANHYTIQLSRSQDIEWILKLAASEKFAQPIIQFQSTGSRGEEWYHLIYGSFPSFQAAESARKSLSDSLKKWSPKLVRFGEVQKQLKK